MDAHLVAVLAQVDEARTCAVGPAVDVDPVVAEEAADVIEIVHRDGRGVEARVGVVARQAGPQARQPDGIGLVQRGQRVAIRSAFQAVRVARAALIDEHDVAGRLHAPERAAHVTGHPRRSLARSPGQKEQGIGPGVVAEGRQHHNLQRDRPALPRLPILEDLEAAAKSVDRPLVNRAGPQTIGRRRRPGTTGDARAGQRQRACQVPGPQEDVRTRNAHEP